MTNINGFDLNLLKVLDALLREGSTVRAAERLHLSQPAVSAALGRLRHALGDPLFVRRGQGLEATDHARALAGPVRDALDLAEAVLAGPSFDPATSRAVFRISGSDFFAEMLMPRLAERLAREAPLMRVHLVDLVPDGYVDTLDRYEVDMALIPSMGLPDRVDHRAVFWSGFSAIARAGHPALKDLAAGQEVPMDVFCALGHVLFSPEGKARSIGDAALAAVGRERRVAMTLPVFSGVWNAVRGSDLIALIPTQLAEAVAPRAGLAVHRPPMPIDDVLIEMIWHRRATTSPAHRWLRDVVAEELLPLNRGMPDLPVREARPASPAP
ncbi:MAG: LysR family transcriptional regulator [Hasllibacter sp.]